MPCPTLRLTTKEANHYRAQYLKGIAPCDLTATAKVDQYLVMVISTGTARETTS